MNNKRLFGFLGFVFVAAVLLACDGGPLTAMISPPTATSTRTPRPTFTPRPTDTPTEVDTPTPDVTDTPEATPTETRRPVARATAKPTPPPAPTTPKFIYHQDANTSIQGRCDTGPSVFEVKGRVINNGNYQGGVHVVILGHDGKIVNQQDTIEPIQMNLEEHVSCFEVRGRYNFQLDISAGRMNSPMTLRLTRGAGDLTPISNDITFDVDPNVGGRWYYNFSNQ